MSASTIEAAFLWNASRDAKFLAQAVAAGIGTEDLVDAEAKRAWGVLQRYYRAHASLPDDEALQEILGEFHHHGLEPEFCLSEIMKRKLFGQLQGLVAQVEGDLRSGNVEAALERVQSLAASGGVSPVSHPENLLSMGPQVLDFYDKVRNGYEGISLPWPTLSGMTRGLWPGTTTMFVARPGVGKTFVAVIAARHAWLTHQVSPLIISPEMGKLELAERFFVVHSGISYADVVQGTLSDMAVDTLRDSVGSVQQGAPPVWIMDSEDDLSPESIDRAIREARPKLVAIDSLYDLHIPAKSKQERLEKALSWARLAAKKHDIPFLLFSQLNRTSELDPSKGGGVRMGTVALSDQVAWDVYSLFALEQTKEMREDRTMKFRKLKLRRGFAPVDEVLTHWDFDEMNFSEMVARTEESSYTGGAMEYARSVLGGAM